MCFNQGMHVSSAEAIELIREISCGKAAGMDGLSGESLKYANHILSVLLSICFTCMFTTCILRYVLFLCAADASDFLSNIFNQHKAEAMVTNH